MSHRIPNPPESGVLNAVRFGTDPFRFLRGVQSRFDSVTAVPIPGRAPLVVVTDPELAHDVLSRPPAFRRVAAQGSASRIAKQGVVQSDGELWRQQRSIMRPAFIGPQVRQYANTVGHRVEELADEWASIDPEGEQRNLHAEMTTLTIRVASEILLGEDIGRDRAAEFYEWMAIAGREFEFSPTTVSPSWFPTRSEPDFDRAAEGIRGLAEEIISRRRETLAREDTEGETATDRRDMLTLLLQAEEDPEVDYPPNQIRDEVATFLIAGHETTALSLSYTLSLLAWHPEARNRVREEATELFGTGPDVRTPEYDDVGELTHTDRAYRESLRLYPPAWATFREASADVRLGGFRVEEGSAVVVPQYSIQRDGQFFDRADEFVPERWARRSPNEVSAYFPFSTGPHACIGQQFALSGATLALARLTQAFDIEVPESALDDLRPTPTLRPPAGVPATIKPAR
jgi:cytochrome P450